MRQDRVSEPGGVVAGRDIVVHRGSVVVLPVFPDGDILLDPPVPSRGIGSFLWELVAGRVEPGESAAGGGAARTHRRDRLHRAPREPAAGDLPFPWICQRTDVDFSRHRTARRAPRSRKRTSASRRKIFPLAALEKMIRQRKIARREIRRRDSFLRALSGLAILRRRRRLSPHFSARDSCLQLAQG